MNTDQIQKHALEVRRHCGELLSAITLVSGTGDPEIRRRHEAALDRAVTDVHQAAGRLRAARFEPELLGGPFRVGRGRIGITPIGKAGD